MIKSWWNTLKSNSGFSLIEALVTIAIVGAAMIPISFVFTQTIGTTVETRKQLVANGLGQEYLEALKAKDFSDYSDIFGVASDDGSLEINADDELTGFTPLPKGYRAILSYDTEVDISEFALGAPKEIPDADITIKLDPSESDRVITIEARRGNPDTISVNYYDTVTDSFINDSIPASSSPSIRFDMGNKVSEDLTTTTRVDIDSNLPQTIYLFFFENATHSIKATTKILSGVVSISRNLNEIDSYDRRIMAIKVEIYDDVSGNKLGTYTTTKIDE